MKKNKSNILYWTRQNLRLYEWIVPAYLLKGTIHAKVTIFRFFKEKRHQVLDHHIPIYYETSSTRNPQSRGGRRSNGLGFENHDFFPPAIFFDCHIFFSVIEDAVFSVMEVLNCFEWKTDFFLFLFWMSILLLFTPTKKRASITQKPFNLEQKQKKVLISSKHS